MVILGQSSQCDQTFKHDGREPTFPYKETTQIRKIFLKSIFFNAKQENPLMVKYKGTEIKLEPVF